MTNDPFDLSANLFDTYLVYLLVGLILFIALVGLIVLLTTSCCCFYCYYYSGSCCFCCCYHQRRYSSYQLNRPSKQQKNVQLEKKPPLQSRQRYYSDLTDFSQLYDSCPHLINSKVMNTVETPQLHSTETNSTIIHSQQSCPSPSSTFQKSVSRGSNHLSHVPQSKLIDPSTSNKVHCFRPFAYIPSSKVHRSNSFGLSPGDQSISSSIIPFGAPRLGSFDHDSNLRTHSPCANIYETVLPTTNSVSNSNRSATPIYETEWRSNVNHLLVNRIQSTNIDPLSVLKLPSFSHRTTSTDYFQQQHPYNRLFSSRISTSDSMRRTNILTQLKNDAAFLY